MNNIIYYIFGLLAIIAIVLVVIYAKPKRVVGEKITRVNCNDIPSIRLKQPVTHNNRKRTRGRIIQEIKMGKISKFIYHS